MKRKLLGALGCALIALAAGCSSQASNTSAAGSSDEAIVAADKQFVEDLKKPPHAIEVAKLSKTPPAGKKVALVDCPTPGCKLLAKAATPAASLLGWTIQVFDGGLTPEKYVSGVEAAIQSKPDYLMITALQPNSTIKDQLAEAAAKGIPVWEVATSDAPAGAVKSVYFGPTTFKDLGASLAKIVTAESDGKGKVVLFHDPSATSYAQADDAFVETLKHDCTGCALSQQKFSTLEIGKSVPQLMESYLQQHPDTDWLVSTFSGAFLGVSQAIKASGLDQVKIVGATSTEADYRTVEQFGNYTVLAVEQTGGYYAVDAFARLAVGDPITPEPKLRQQWVTQDTVKSFDSGKQWVAPDIAKTYGEAWGVEIPSGFVEVMP
jgi:ribose transport system substrate-binding protein